MSEYDGTQQPGHDPNAQQLPRTQQMPQQPGPGGYPQAPAPGSTNTAQVVLLTILSVAATAAVVFFLLVVFGVVGDDDPANVDAVDVPQAPATLVDGQVAAIAQTVFSCPEGSMGTPTIDNTNCTVPATSETVPALQSEETTYRCPSGASGSPSAASPVCATAVSGTVAATAVTTLFCPEGSSGSPTPASPTCTGGEQILRVPTEPITTYECRFDTQRDDSVDPPECVLFLGRVQDVAAVELTVFTCGSNFEPNAADESQCDRVFEPLCRPVVFSNDRFICYPGPEPMDIGLPDGCPTGWERRPDLPERNGDNWCYEFSEPCIFLGSSYVLADDNCRRLNERSATAIAGYICPAEIDAPDAAVVLDRCQFSGPTEVRQPAEGSTVYRCPPGSVGEGGSPDAVCVFSEASGVPALASTTYQCPTGSVGAPTTQAPICTSTSTNTVDAIVEITTVYECPSGTVGSPNETNSQCASTAGAETVPAVATTAYSCPTGSTGTPSATDPFCR